MNVYLMFVKTPEGEPRSGVLLAENRADALSKAVNYCKGTFGPGSKVTLIGRSEISNAILGRGVFEEDLVGGPVTEARAGAIV